MGVTVCQFGVVHSKCRCMCHPAPRIDCDRPEDHSEGPSLRGEPVMADSLRCGHPACQGTYLHMSEYRSEKRLDTLKSLAALLEEE